VHINPVRTAIVSTADFVKRANLWGKIASGKMSCEQCLEFLEIAVILAVDESIDRSLGDAPSHIDEQASQQKCDDRINPRRTSEANDYEADNDRSGCDAIGENVNAIGDECGGICSATR